jgi:hypothetical protein
MYSPPVIGGIQYTITPWPNAHTQKRHDPQEEGVVSLGHPEFSLLFHPEPLED